MTATSPRIAIVGAGIGGLTLALLLRKRGVPVQIYEQASELREVGAAVALAANGSRVMRRLGLGDALAEYCVEPTDVVFRHWASGNLIATYPMGQAYRDRYGAEFFGIHRKDLQRVLAGAWGTDGLHLNSRVVDLEEGPDGVRLHFAEGDPVTADIVVGADGVRSTVRDWVTGGGLMPQFSGGSGFRGLAQVSDVAGLADPMTIQFWLGPGGYVISYPISAETVNFLAVRPGPMPWPHPTWMVEEPPGTAIVSFEGWHPTVRALVGSVEQSPRWALFAIPALQRWTRGTTVLLGDAAHAMLPHQGQGANQAVEDAAVLSALLAEVTGSTDGPTAAAAAVRRYERLRRTRTRQLQVSSWDNATILGYPDGPEADARDEKLRSLPDRLDWIHGYDIDDVLTPGATLPYAPAPEHRSPRPRSTHAQEALQ